MHDGHHGQDGHDIILSQTPMTLRDNAEWTASRRQRAEGSAIAKDLRARGLKRITPGFSFPPTHVCMSEAATGKTTLGDTAFGADFMGGLLTYRDIYSIPIPIVCICYSLWHICGQRIFDDLGI